MATSRATGATKPLTPLWVISLFVSLAEVALGVAATQTSGGIQIALTAFVIAFPVLVASAFFIVLWKKAYVFYPPSEYANVDVQKYVEALNSAPPSMVTKTADVAGKIETFGKPDRFQLLFKASGATWSRSTKAMEVSGGCLVQVSTKFLAPQGEWTLAEAVSYVPGVTIQEEQSGSGRFLIAREATS